MRYDLGNGAVVFVSGLYRVAESGSVTGTVLPRVASTEDNLESAAREAYSVGIERRAGDSSVRFEASSQQMDEVVRAVRRHSAHHTRPVDACRLEIDLHRIDVPSGQ